MLQRTPWTLALLVALALPALGQSRGAPGEPHYNGWDIEKKFNEIDEQLKGVRALRDLQDRDKATLRRIMDMEASIRDLRTSVHGLELRLRTIDATLVGIQKELELAREAGPRLVADTKPGTATIPGAPEKPQGPVAAVEKEEVRSEMGFHTVTGQVRNLTDKPLTFVVVRADFLDARGEVVKTESAYTSPQIIPARGTAGFKLQTRAERRIRSHRITIEAK